MVVKEQVVVDSVLFGSVLEDREMCSGKKPGFRYLAPFFSFEMLFIVALIFIPVADSGIVWSAVSLNPAVTTACQPTEIKLEIQFDGGVAEGDTVTFSMGGFTSGSCANAAGNSKNLGNVLLWPRASWEASWSEGTVANEYRDSRLTLQAQSRVESALGYRHEIFVDPSNLIRPNCYIPANFSFIKVTATISNDTIGTNQAVNRSDHVSAPCYLTSTALQFRPAIPKVPSNIDVTFVSSILLRAGDSLIVNVAGWTSGTANGVSGPDIPNLALQDAAVLAGNTSLYFEASWYEGCCYEQHEHGYRNSTLVFRIRPSVTITPGTQMDVIVKNGQVRAQCGMPLSELQTMRIVTNEDNNETNIPARPIESATVVGDGCASLNYCNQHGECNFCLNRCDCHPGFGAPFEASFRHLSDWTCEERSCPYGPTWAGIPSHAGYAHGDMSECSGAGLCKRNTGKCKCFKHFEGPACERRLCPGYSAETGDCSGHGVCGSMRDLAREPDALPLSPYGNRSYTFTENQFPSNVWDARRVFGCVCDSSWPVGLDIGESNEPEWFGPDCSLRHCPSGDDPMTRRDETDCYNVSSTLGTAVYPDDAGVLGKNGSLCHVDCSNRGKCDYETGVCACFAGFRGPNCGIIDVLARASDDE